MAALPHRPYVACAPSAQVGAHRPHRWAFFPVANFLGNAVVSPPYSVAVPACRGLASFSGPDDDAPVYDPWRSDEVGADEMGHEDLNFDDETHLPMAGDVEQFAGSVVEDVNLVVDLNIVPCVETNAFRMSDFPLAPRLDTSPANESVQYEECLDEEKGFVEDKVCALLNHHVKAAYDDPSKWPEIADLCASLLQDAADPQLAPVRLSNVYILALGHGRSLIQMREVFKNMQRPNMETYQYLAFAEWLSAQLSDVREAMKIKGLTPDTMMMSLAIETLTKRGKYMLLASWLRTAAELGVVPTMDALEAARHAVNKAEKVQGKVLRGVIRVLKSSLELDTGDFEPKVAFDFAVRCFRMARRLEVEGATKMALDIIYTHCSEYADDKFWFSVVHSLSVRKKWHVLGWVLGVCEASGIRFSPDAGWVQSWAAKMERYMMSSGKRGAVGVGIINRFSKVLEDPSDARYAPVRRVYDKIRKLRREEKVDPWALPPTLAFKDD